jgi:ERCC4-type nuclease
MEFFGSVEKILASSADEIARSAGMPRETAERLLERLRVRASDGAASQAAGAPPAEPG